jgi:hypothetical protein
MVAEKQFRRIAGYKLIPVLIKELETLTPCKAAQRNRRLAVMARGNAKVMCHLMFGIVALTADQTPGGEMPKPARGEDDFAPPKAPNVFWEKTSSR